MAVIVTDNRTVRNEADANTGWTGTTTLLTTDPDPIEATGCLGATVGAAIFDSYHTAAAADLSNRIIYCWVYPRGVVGNRFDANGGLMVHLGDGTNRAAYKVAGSDVAGFRHDLGPTPWQNLALDTSNRPASPLSRQGSEASLNFAAITQVGTTVNSLVAAPGMAATYIVDIIRIFDPTINDGCALTITGGTSGDPGTFSELAGEDALTANLKAHGICRQLGAGVFGVQGPLRFGNPTGTASSWFEDRNSTVVFEAREFTDARYKIFITDNGTGTTTFKLGDKVGTGIDALGSNGVNITAATGVGMEFDANTDADVTDVFLYGCIFTGFNRGVKLRQGHEFIGGSIVSSGQVIADGATMVNSEVLQSTVAVDASALRWNVNLNPDTYLHGMSYSKGTNAHHAIEFGLTSPLDMTLRNIAFSGFSASNNVNDSTLNILRTTGTVTISLVGCTGNISYKTAGATVVLVQDPVTTTVTVRDINTGDPVENARVYMVADTGGPLSVGTVIIQGLTDVNGQISDTRTLASPQPVTGWVRRATSGTLYKQGPIAGTISNLAGLSLTVQMIPDE
jgi:hypothetical protein